MNERDCLNSKELKLELYGEQIPITYSDNKELIRSIVAVVARCNYEIIGGRFIKFDMLSDICVYSSLIHFLAQTNKVKGMQISDFIFRYGIHEYAKKFDSIGKMKKARNADIKSDQHSFISGDFYAESNYFRKLMQTFRIKEFDTITKLPSGKHRNEKGRYEYESIPMCFLSEAYAIHYVNYLKSESYDNINRFGLDASTIEAYLTFSKMYNTYERRFKASEEENTSVDFKNAVKAYPRYSAFLMFYKFYRETACSSVLGFIEYAGVGLYRGENRFCFSAIIYLMALLKCCNNRVDKYRLALKYACIKIVPYHNIRLEISKYETLSDIDMVIRWLGSLIASVKRQCYKIFDLLINEHVLTDDWLADFQYLANNLCDNALYGGYIFDSSNQNQDDFVIILKMWSEYYAFLDGKSMLNKECYDFMQEFFREQKVPPGSR